MSVAVVAPEPPYHLIARLPNSSNGALIVAAEDDSAWVYKPSRLTRELSDYDAQTLARREVAAYRIQAALGCDLIPPTLLIDGPLGSGSLQQLLTPLELSYPQDAVLTPQSPLLGVPFDALRLHGAQPPPELTIPAPLLLIPGEEAPAGYRGVLELAGEEEQPLLLAQLDHPDLRAITLLDLILGSGDRKGSHLLATYAQGQLHFSAVDNGLSLADGFHQRTVLWGLAGEEFTAAELSRLDAVEQLAATATSTSALGDLLTAEEWEALAWRAQTLRGLGGFPQPFADPFVPWPLW